MQQPPRRDTELAETLASDSESGGGSAALGLGPGELVGHYEVRRRIGSGGMGDVYLARDMTLGRRVALKLVRSDHRLSDATLERFLTEARATARFNHPNIVAIYGAGEHRGAPYVALEYVRGQDLGERLLERPPSIPEALRIAGQIAEALAEAHGYGVLHCDLKPDNVIIARDGRVRVLDFGLAVFVGALDPEEPSSAELRKAQGGSDTAAEPPLAGTPEYMAPEQWLREPLSGGTDIWALGVILHELCTGRRLFEGTTLHQIGHTVTGFSADDLVDLGDTPEQITRLVKDCLAREPGKRPQAREVARRLDEVLHPAARVEDDRCPYRGLLPFDQRDAELFFGREAAINAIAERARHDTVLPVVGPSGAGKSSLVQAGLIPRLREHGRWMVLRLRPGTHPFRALAARLARVDSRTSSRSAATRKAEPDPARITLIGALAEELRESPRRLGMELELAAERSGSNVLLFIDQLEELYTHGHDEALCQRFVEAVASAADDADGPVRVVFTLRGDFLDRLAAVPEARDALAHVTVLHRPGPRELRDILVKPLELLGYHFDDAELPEAMVQAVGGEPACLPLLQFAAQRLWEERDVARKLLLRSAYDRMGGVEGALAGHADGVIAGMSASERRVGRQLLLRLVTSRQTRRVVSKPEALRDLGVEGERVLSRLVAARLVTVKSADAPQAHAQIELAHESLIHMWDRLAQWIEETKEERGYLADVGQAAELWEKRGRRAAELWQDEALSEALRTVKRLDLALPAVAQYFLDAAEKRQRRRRLRKRLAIAAAVTASLALSIVFALQSEAERGARGHAERQRQIAETKRAESLREGARAALGQGSLLEARAKLREALEGIDDVSARTLWWQLERHPLSWEQRLGTGVYGVTFAGHGSSVAAAGQDGSIHLFDAVTARRRVLRGNFGHVLGVAGSPDGTLLASGHTKGAAIVWSLRDGTRVYGIEDVGASVRVTTFDRSGEHLVVAAYDGSVRLLSLPDGKVQWQLAKVGPEIQGAAFLGSSKLALLDVQGALTVVDVGSGTIETTRQTGLSPARGLAVSRDARRLALSGSGRIQIWDAAKLELEREMVGHAGLVYGVAFHPNGRMLASSSYDRSIALWDVASGRLLVRVDDAHGGEVHQVAFDKSGERLASVSWDGSVRLWSVHNLALQSAPRAHHGAIYRVAYAPDGRLLASAGTDHSLRLWDATTGAIARTIPVEARASGVAFSPDGARLASGSGNVAQVWDLQSGAELTRLLGHEGEIWDVEFHPREELLLSAGEDGTARLWQLGPGRQLRALRGHQADVYRAAFRSDGERIVTAGRDRTARIWSTASGQELHLFPRFEDRVYGVDFLEGAVPDGDSIVATGFDGALRRVSIASDRAELLTSLGSRAWDLDVAAGWVGAATSDGIAVLWNVDERRALRLRGHRGEVNSIRISADGRGVVTGSDDGTVRLWRLEDGLAAWRAPALLPSPRRLLSHRGWERLEIGAAPQPGRAELPPKVTAVLERTARHASMAAGRWLCVLTQEDGAELWDTQGDRREGALTGPVQSLLATERGCLAQTNGKALLVRAGEADVVLASEVAAVGHGAGGIALLAKDQVRVFDEEGNEGDRLQIAAGAVAVAPLEGVVAIGYPEGSVELHVAGKEPRRLEQVPSSAPITMIAGPSGTLVIGFANGIVGIWSLHDGRPLAQEQLHGAVVHLLADGSVIAAASELGSHVLWDLALLERDRCEVLREVWRQVPVGWEDGRVVLRPPPADHACAPGGGG